MGGEERRMSYDVNSERRVRRATKGVYNQVKPEIKKYKISSKKHISYQNPPEIVRCLQKISIVVNDFLLLSPCFVLSLRSSAAADPLLLPCFLPSSTTSPFPHPRPRPRPHLLHARLIRFPKPPVVVLQVEDST
eukprot:749543-Hanusia_phi.AAC.1